MNCNSCNRNSAQNYSGNCGNNPMYRSTQLARNGQMNRMGTCNRSSNGRMMNRMTMDSRKENHGCNCADDVKQECDCQSDMNHNSDCRGQINHNCNSKSSMNRNNDCMQEMSQTYRCDMHSCNQATEPVDSMMIAMAYVPWQQWGEIYDYEKALQCGTIFDDLNKPWTGRACE